MLLSALPRITFIGGKGGVGKTTVAAALGVSRAERGERCLIVSTDPAHSLGDIFDLRIGNRERRLLPDLHGIEIDPDAQVERHLDQVRRSLREMVRPDLHAEVDRQMELTRLSPGAVEAALLERVAEIVTTDASRYDRVIFDTAPTGHTLRLLALPEIMAAWTDGLLRQRDRSDHAARALGRMQRAGGGDDLSYVDQASPTAEDPRAARIRDTLMARRRTFARARRVLLDHASTGFILVMIPERLPILESGRALDVLRRFDIPLLGIVVNRVLPAAPLGGFLEQRRAQEARYLDQIAARFAGIRRLDVPLLPGDVHGLEGLRTLARLL